MDPLRLRRRRAKGYSTIELVVFLAIVLMMLALGLHFMGMRPYEGQAAKKELASLMTRAVEVAATSGNGATIVFTNSGTAYTAVLYPGRPNPGGTLGAAAETVSGNINVYWLSSGGTVQNFAIFVDSDGSADPDNWQVSDGTVVSEPSCPSPFELETSGPTGAILSTLNLDCSKLQIY